MSAEIRWFLAELPPTYKEVVVVPLGDVHYGSSMFSSRHFNRDLDLIAKTDNMVVLFF